MRKDKHLPEWVAPLKKLLQELLSEKEKLEMKKPRRPSGAESGERIADKHGDGTP